MKTKNFIITLVALFAFAGNASAQRDITSQYITNAKLSNGTAGWTITNRQDGPAQGNNTDGYAVEFYAGWDRLAVTSYNLLQTITLPKGNYRLTNYSFFRHFRAAGLGLRNSVQASAHSYSCRCCFRKCFFRSKRKYLEAFSVFKF